jgi:hypothetical protein
VRIQFSCKQVVLKLLTRINLQIRGTPLTKNKEKGGQRCIQLHDLCGLAVQNVKYHFHIYRPSILSGALATTGAGAEIVKRRKDWQRPPKED